MSDIFWELVFILALILVNGVFAMSEIALVSARKTRLQQRAIEGDDRARIALELAAEPNKLLSTVQIGITLVGILAGAFGGATIAEELGIWIARSSAPMAPYGEAIGITLVVVAITYLSLVLGELAPKRVGLNDPERIAMLVAGPIRLLSQIVTPLVRILGKSTNLVLRMAGARSPEESPVTEEEIKILIDQGTQAGVFQEAEQDMVEGVFRLGDRRIGTLMTPRGDVVWLDLDDPPEKTEQKMSESIHSRFPVAEGSLEAIQGVAQAKELLAKRLRGEALEWESSLEPALFVPENTPALEILKIFRESGEHMLLVIDEYGGFQGLVTATDLLEAIVGEVPEAGEKIKPEIVQRKDGSWLLDGMLPVDEFMDSFNILNMPGEGREFQTMGGFVMAQLGRIPATGDSFEWGSLRFEVVDMDGRRVDKILMTMSKGVISSG